MDEKSEVKVVSVVTTSLGDGDASLELPDGTPGRVPGLLDLVSPGSDTASMKTCASSFESPSGAAENASASSGAEMHTAASSTLQGSSGNSRSRSTSGELHTADSRTHRDSSGAGSNRSKTGSESDGILEESFRPEQMEFYDSPRMLMLAAQQGRAPFAGRTSSSGSSMKSDVEESDDEARPNRIRPNVPDMLDLPNGDGQGSDEEDTYTFKADLTPGMQDVHLTKKASERPNSLSVPNGAAGGKSGAKKKKISVADDLLNTADDVSSILDQTEEMFTAPMGDDDATENLVATQDLETPDEIDDSIMERLSELEFDEDRTPTPEELRLELGALDLDDVTLNGAPGATAAPKPEPIPTLSAAEEREEARNWRQVVIAGIERRVDMKAIEPYKKVLSHGGYMEDSNQAIIVFTACYLPDHSRRDYEYVMDNLFLYCLTTLDTLIAEDYLLVYLHGATHRSRIPSFKWIRKCYQMIDRRLRKNLKALYIVHPTFLVKTLVTLTRPFISTKFSRKMRFVGSLAELSRLVPMGQVVIPEKVRTYDDMYYAPDRGKKKQEGVKEEQTERRMKPGIKLSHGSTSDSDDDGVRGASEC